MGSICGKNASESKPPSPKLTGHQGLNQGSVEVMPSDPAITIPITDSKNTASTPTKNAIFMGFSDSSFSPGDVLESTLKRPYSTLKEIKIVLVPHKHSVFCERKERVCTAVGKIQEFESLKAIGLESKLTGSDVGECCWLRSMKRYIPSPEPTDYLSDFEEISSSKGLPAYVMTAEDVGRYIGFKLEVNDETFYSASVVGPVLPGPPRISDLRILGSMAPEQTIQVVGNYIGGEEGESEIWWMRIRDGERENITEASTSRTYTIKNEDVGCVLKAKYRPIRSDGLRGEIFTSKPSGIVEAPAAFSI